MLKKVLFALGALLVLAALVVACAPATPVATEAPATEVPTVAAPTEVPPTPTEDPAVLAQALFEKSAHANVDAEAFKHWDAADPKEVPTSCAKCHTAAGFQDFIADGKVDAAVPAPAGAFTCEMCHNDAAKALTSVTFPSGAVIENLGPEAICMTCHQGRESKVSLDAKIAKFGENLDPDAMPAPYKDDQGKDVKLSFSNVHYFAAGGTLYGSQVHMGYEYDGKTYDIKNQHVEGFNTCLGCHDQHSQKVKVEACTECHENVKTAEDLKNIRQVSSAKDYDGDGDVKEGIALEISGLQQILYTSIQTYAAEVAGAEIKYDPATYPYFMGADGKAYTNWTPRLLKAAYNYQVSVKDPGAFAHGGKYIIELLYDSTADLNSSDKLTTKLDMKTITREDAGHFDGAAAAFRHWDVASADGKKPAFVVEAACAKCHSASGLPTLIAGQTIPETGVPAGNGFMCSTCHDVTNFPARLAVKDVTMPSGKVVSFGDGADSNLCISCHQGRASKKDVDAKIEKFNAAADQDKVVEAIKDATTGNDVKFSFINAHYLGVAAVWFGTDAQGFYEYEGKTYLGANPHVPVDGKPGCVGCHDVHAGSPKEELCQQCHGAVAIDDIRGMSSTADYNGNGDVTEGIRMEYRVLRDALYAEIQTYAKAKTGNGIAYDTNTYPYWFVDNDGDGKADLKDGKKVAFSTWTPRLFKAAFNFNFLRKNPGAQVHNAKYVIQIAIDTIEDLGGDISKYVRP
ncbi:MAG: hypothetical protein Fur0035_23070 [Anaerolineales bacterium]